MQRFAWRSRRSIRNKARSLLTMLGIVIGVAAVIVTVAIGTGARVSVQQQHQRARLESDRRAARQRHHDRSARRARRRIDADARRRDRDCTACPGVAAVSPVVTCARKSSPAETTGRRSISGVAPDLHVHSLVAHRERPLLLAKRSRLDRQSCGARANRRAAALLATANPDRSDDRDQGRTVHGDRHAGSARAERNGPRPRRHGPDPLYLGDGAPHRSDHRQSAHGFGGERRSHRRRTDRNDDAARTAPPHRRAAAGRLSSAQLAVDRAGRLRNRNRDGTAAWPASRPYR